MGWVNRRADSASFEFAAAIIAAVVILGVAAWLVSWVVVADHCISMEANNADR